MAYSRLKIFVLIFLIAYCLIGVSARLLSKGEEDFYPFFSWFLFSTVPSRIQNDIALRIHHAGDRKFDPPIFFEDTQGIYNNELSHAEYTQMIRRIGYSLKQNNNIEAESLRKQLESNFLVSPLVYEIVEVEYNPIERYKSGKVRKVNTIEFFEIQEEY